MTAGARPAFGAFAAWWSSVDRLLLGAVIALTAAGVMLSMSASGAAAARLGLDEANYFFTRHIVYAVLALGVCLAVSTLSPLGARRLSAVVLVGSIALLILTVFIGVEVNGARRWLRLGGLSLQPVEFAKPALAVTAAWLLAESAKSDGPPGGAIALAVFAAVAALTLAQPDFGQTALMTAVFGGLFFLAGMPWRWLMGFAVAAGVGVLTAALTMPHVASRIARFVDPAAGDTYQVDRARAAIENGGVFGVGPGDGEIKRALPDAHTDFIFAVAIEEFGVVFGLALLMGFTVLVCGGLARARRLADPTARYAAAALAALLGLQALINIAVNLGMIPPKGMTLPFISYGGSSLVASGLTAGLLIAFTRRRPGAYEQPDRPVILA